MADLVIKTFTMVYPARLTSSCALACALLSLFSFSVRLSADSFPWEQSHPPLTNFSFTATTHAEGMFVAVGVRGGIITSLDGHDWRREEAPTFEDLNAVIHTGERFIAAGDAGTLLLSLDGASWEEQILATEAALRDVAHGNGRTVVVSSGGEAWVSEDDSTWSAFTIGMDGRAVAFSEGRFWAVGAAGGISSSVDGETWTDHSVGGNASFHSVAAGPDGVVVAVGEAGRIVSSVDGGTWVERTSPVPVSLDLHRVAFINGRWLAFSFRGISATSTDGVDWELLQIPTTTWIRGAAEGEGLAIAVTWHGTILGSADGLEWQSISEYPRIDLAGIDYFGFVAGRPRWIAVGGVRSRTGVLVSEDNGETWTTILENQYDVLHAIATRNTPGGQIALILADGGRVLTATDPTMAADPAGWTEQQLPSEFRALVREGGLFLGGGFGGVLVTSPDGVNWTERDSGTSHFLNDFTHGSGGFVGVGGSGDIIWSPDGVDWKVVARGAGMLRSVAYRPGLYVAVGSGGAVARSIDGITWEKFRLSSLSLTSINSLGDAFAATGGEPFGMWTSSDGKGWTHRPLEGAPPVASYWSGPRQVWAYGFGGTLVKVEAFRPRISGKSVWIPGNTEHLSTAAFIGGAPYQWFKDGVEIPDATERTLAIENVRASDAGLYRLRLVYQGRFVTSDIHEVRVSETFSEWRDRVVAAGAPGEWEGEERGRDLLRRYALGIPAGDEHARRLPHAARTAVTVDGEEAEYLTLVFHRRGWAPDLQYRIEISEDLVEWLDVTAEVELLAEGVPSLPGSEFEVERVTVRHPSPLADHSSAFMRVRVVDQAEEGP